jgi:hypothetical protein
MMWKPITLLERSDKVGQRARSTRPSVRFNEDGIAAKVGPDEPAVDHEHSQDRLTGGDGWMLKLHLGNDASVLEHLRCALLECELSFGIQRFVSFFPQRK